MHNDLNHKNILKSENGWNVIDPHGVVGEKTIETTQFIKSEIEMNKSDINDINKIVLSISKELGEDKKLILKFLYIRIIEKIIWFVKVNENKDIISYNIDVANNVLKLIKNE